MELVSTPPDRGILNFLANATPAKSKRAYLLYRKLVVFALSLSAIILSMTGMSIGDAIKVLIGLSAIVLL